MADHLDPAPASAETRLSEEDREALVLALGCMYHAPGYGECAACSAHAEQVWDDAVERIVARHRRQAVREALAEVEALADEWHPFDGTVMSNQRYDEGYCDGLRYAAVALRAAIARAKGVGA